MGWSQIDTVRCEGCRIFTDTREIQWSAEGTAHCVRCGVPAAPSENELAPLRGRFRFRSPVTIAAAAVGAITLASFVAAWVSQL